MISRSPVLPSILLLAGVSLPAIGADTVHKHKVLEHATATITITITSADNDAHMQAVVAEQGYAGARYALAPDTVEGIPGYSADVRIPGRVPYRSLIHVTLLMFPVLVYMYVRLARSEEREMHAHFGAEYTQYAARTPRFLPRPRRPARTGAA